jgi:dGTP triphosphohydrolase
MDGLNTVDAVQENVVDSQEVVESSETSVNTTEVAEPVQNKDENAKYAAARREAEARALQAEQEAAELKKDIEYIKKYKEYGITSREDLAQYGYSSWEDLDNAMEAQEKNVDPEIYSRLKNAETIAQQANEKLSKYERKEKIDGELAAWKQDPTYGEFFNKWESDIKDIALKANCDLYPALLMVMGQRANELKSPNVEEIKKTAVKEYIEGLKKQSPVEGGGQSPAVVQKSNNSWDEARKSALQFLRSKKE